MRVLCDSCGVAAGSVVCTTEEKALCGNCDSRIHDGSHIGRQHKRVELKSRPASNVGTCDICKDAAAFAFCLEGRAILCKDCDDRIHMLNEVLRKHQRFLLTGVQLATPPAPANTKTAAGTTTACMPSRVWPPATDAAPPHGPLPGFSPPCGYPFVPIPMGNPGMVPIYTRGPPTASGRPPAMYPSGHPAFTPGWAPPGFVPGPYISREYAARMYQAAMTEYAHCRRQLNADRGQHNADFVDSLMEWDGVGAPGAASGAAGPFRQGRGGAGPGQSNDQGLGSKDAAVPLDNSSWLGELDLDALSEVWGGPLEAREVPYYQPPPPAAANSESHS